MTFFSHKPYIISLRKSQFVVVVYSQAEVGASKYNHAVKELRCQLYRTHEGFIVYNEEGGIILLTKTRANYLLGDWLRPVEYD